MITLVITSEARLEYVSRLNRVHSIPHCQIGASLQKLVGVLLQLYVKAVGAVTDTLNRFVHLKEAVSDSASNSIDVCSHLVKGWAPV